MRLNHDRASAKRAQARRLRAAGFKRWAIAADMGLSEGQVTRLLGRRKPKGMRRQSAKVIKANFPELAP